MNMNPAAAVQHTIVRELSVKLRADNVRTQRFDSVQSGCELELGKPQTDSLEYTKHHRPE